VDDYAEFLTTRAAAGSLHPAVIGLSMGSRKSELYRRVIMLLTNQPLESRTPRVWTAAITVTALVLVAVVAAVSLVPRVVAEEKPATRQVTAAEPAVEVPPAKDRSATKEAAKTESTPVPIHRSAAEPNPLTVDLGGGVKMEIILIPAGEFLMGSPKSDKYAFFNEKPQHRVRITKPFCLGKYLVTQEQWQTVMGNNPSKFKGPKKPVEQVSWDDCQTYLAKLNAKTRGNGGKSQLPSGAQWEYACRAGSKTRYYFGDDESQLGEYAWYEANLDDGRTHPVGEKKPNDWGLYDMHGNVFEWCAGFNHRYENDSPKDDPTGPTTGWGRAIRGG
jgi:formylglycine-generating enzyme required for sulfatase activity